MSHGPRQPGRGTQERRSDLKGAEGTATGDQPALPALAPRRKLLWILSAALALWIALLLVIYFTTVYPARSHSLTTTSPFMRG